MKILKLLGFAVLSTCRIESRRAASQFMDAGGPRLILKVLSAQAALSLFRLLRYLDLGS